MQTTLEKVLGLDVDHLSQEELRWLHELKNKAMVISARMKLRILENENKGDTYDLD